MWGISPSIAMAGTHSFWRRVSRPNSDGSAVFSRSNAAVPFQLPLASVVSMNLRHPRRQTPPSVR
jgi:hypothetical protein